MNEQSNSLNMDEKMLDELGFSSLGHEQKMKLLESTCEELENRVGKRFTENMSDSLLDEFGLFVDMDLYGMKRWFNLYLPDYQEKEGYKLFCKDNPSYTEREILSWYGSIMWLRLNCPSYPEIIHQVFEEIKQELKMKRAEIFQIAALYQDNFKKDTEEGNND